MKSKLFAAVAVFALSASVAFAGPGEGKSGKRGGARGEASARFAEKLNLTPAQQQRIRNIKEQTRQQNAAFFEQVRETRQQLRAAKKAGNTARVDALKSTARSQHAQMKQIRESERQLILTVLNPEQRRQFEQLRAEREARRDGKRDGRHKQR